MINQKFIFVFDLDNTLVKTNQANNESYKDAIFIVTGQNVRIKKNRFTRINLCTVLPNLTDSQIAEIVQEKENLYEKYISKTILNKQLVKILNILKKNGCETILLTESRQSRAKFLCAYYSLTQLFSKIYFKENYINGDKYQFLQQISTTLQSVILFENEPLEIRRAIKNGIREEQIIKVNF